MTILRLDLHAGGWRAVSPRLFEDERLSLDTRAVAGYISTRSDSFSLNVSGLCSLLKIGEDKWRRMNTELTNAGYLKRIQGKDKKGRFRHELVFSPIPGQHDLDDLSEKQLRAIPKKPVQPGAVSPETTKPRPAIPGSTRNQMDHISDYHQRGGGMTDPSNLTIPSFWIEAAEYEIEVEGLKKPVQNRSGLFRTIINRYRANGGPDSGVLAELKKKEAADFNSSDVKPTPSSCIEKYK